MGLYTSAELIAKLKALDVEMDSAETSSKLDTGQSRHEFTLSINSLKQQYEKYLAMLMQVDPQAYYEIVGPSAIRFTGGSSCRPCRY